MQKIFWFAVGAVTNTALLITLAHLPVGVGVTIGEFWFGATIAVAAVTGGMILAGREPR